MLQEQIVNPRNALIVKAGTGPVFLSLIMINFKLSRFIQKIKILIAVFQTHLLQQETNRKKETRTQMRKPEFYEDR